MNKYKITCRGYEVDVSASSYPIATSRALKALKRQKIIKESDDTVCLSARKIKNPDGCQ